MGTVTKFIIFRQTICTRNYSIEWTIYRKSYFSVKFVYEAKYESGIKAFIK